MQSMIAQVKSSENLDLQKMLDRFKGYQVLCDKNLLKTMVAEHPAVSMYQISKDGNDVCGFYFPEYYAYGRILFFYGLNELQRIVQNDLDQLLESSSVWSSFTTPIILKLNPELEQRANLIRDILVKEDTKFLVVNSDSRQTLLFGSERAPKGISLKDMLHWLSLLSSDDNFHLKWLNENAPHYFRALTEAWQICLSDDFVPPLISGLVQEIEGKIFIEKACDEVDREGRTD